MAGLVEMAQMMRPVERLDQGRMFERLTNMLPQDMPLAERLQHIEMMQRRKNEPVVQDRLLANLQRSFEEEAKLKKTLKKPLVLGKSK
jgi:hypothetical protein